MSEALRTVRATRYAAPLREGGSLPGIVEADDDGMYVVKFRGAGQGVKALIAEIVVGELARAAGLPVPEIVLVDVDPVLGRAEPDPEIQELITASAGLNVGLDFLPGSLAYDTAFAVDPSLAAKIVFLDDLVLNIDRTPRNPNLLVWHDALWLIDHGAALFPHHAGPLAPHAERPFPAIVDHVLMTKGSDPNVNADPPNEPILMTKGSDPFVNTVAYVPEEWLDRSPDDYVEFLERRMEFLTRG